MYPVVKVEFVCVAESPAVIGILTANTLGCWGRLFRRGGCASERRRSFDRIEHQIQVCMDFA